MRAGSSLRAIKRGGYYDICADEGGFSVKYTPFGKTEERSFDDVFFSEWLGEPTAFGAFEGGELIGYVEGSPERWNNRFLISNICVFENARRGSSVGTVLLDAIQEAAAASGARSRCARRSWASGWRCWAAAWTSCAPSRRPPVREKARC